MIYLIFLNLSWLTNSLNLTSLFHSVVLSREKLVLLELVDLRVLRDPVENLAHLDHLDLLEPL